MSITQSRMIALIDAANAFRSAFMRIDKSLIDLNDQVKSGAIAPADAYTMIYNFVGIKLVEDYENAAATIEIETRHFRRNQRRNDRIRVAQARKRREQGITPRVPINTLERINQQPAMPSLAQPIPRLDPLNGLTPQMAEQHRREADASIIKWQPQLARELGLTVPEPGLPADWTDDDPENTFNPGELANDHPGGMNGQAKSDFNSMSGDAAEGPAIDGGGSAIPDDITDRNRSGSDGGNRDDDE